MITLQNISGDLLSIDIDIDGVRAVRARLAPGASQALTQFTPDELSTDAEVRALIDAGKIRIRLSPGIVEARTFTLTDGGQDAADDVVALTSLPYPARVLDVILRVETAEAGETVTVQSVTGGSATGNELKSSALSGASTGVVRDARATQATILRGEPIILRRSNDGIEGELTLILERTAL